jgi:hypothetical protein
MYPTQTVSLFDDVRLIGTSRDDNARRVAKKNLRKELQI